MILNPDEFEFRTATKTKPIKAKPIDDIVIDKSVFSQFLLTTLEGNQPLKDGSMLCIGEANDAWQQPPEKLLAKYDIAPIEDGWLICTPKPDNEIWAAQVDDLPHPRMLPPGWTKATQHEFAVKAQWGKKQPDGSFLLYGKVGDYICRSKEDADDVWIVQQKLFENTYEFLEQ